MVISGERVKQARELKELTQAALAKAIGVSQGAIAQIELGGFMASDELVAAIAARTGKPLRFFQQEPAPEFPIGSLLFRSHASLTKKDITSTYRHAQLAYELWLRLSEGLTLPPISIPRLSVTPIEAAREMRKRLRIPANEPVPHLLNLLEWHGLVAVVVPDIKSRDAFSHWFTETPVMALSSGRPGDRARLTVAHELGHLILHAGKSRFEIDDSEADDFAAEFLMPEGAMRRELKIPVTISSLAGIKPRWRVSIQALVYRCKELGIITERQYRYLFEQISAMGWRKAEPVQIVLEQPRALRQMAEMRFGDPIDYTAFAHEAAMDAKSLSEILADYAGKAAAPVVPTNIISLSRKRPR